jgi:hypothetical protein
MLLALGWLIFLNVVQVSIYPAICQLIVHYDYFEVLNSHNGLWTNWGSASIIDTLY